ncbi:MAG: hypothetical protein U0271_00835 [Polyangiaceae bacterium]
MRPNNMSGIAVLRAGVLVLVLGCGSEVIAPGDGGSSNNGGQPSVGGSGGAGASSAGGFGGALVGGSPNTTTVGGSGGGLPGTPCEQLCQKIEGCGFPGCAQAGIDCNNPQTDCPATCLQDATCADLVAVVQGNPPPEIATCLQGCQGGGQTCQQCIQNSCVQAATPCFQDNSCQGWLGCVQNCQTSQCFFDCDAQFAGSAPLYDPIYACACQNCGMECAMGLEPCSHGSTGTGGAGVGGAPP